MSYSFPLLEASYKSAYTKAKKKKKKMCIETEQGVGATSVSLSLGAVLISCSERFLDESKVMPECRYITRILLPGT